MTTTEHGREKRWVPVVCEHPPGEALCDCRRAAVDAILARWSAEATEPPLEAGRERVALADIRPPRGRVTLPPPPVAAQRGDGDRDVLGAAGAWACVALVILLMAVLAMRQLVLWWSP